MTDSARAIAELRRAMADRGGVTYRECWPRVVVAGVPALFERVRVLEDALTQSVALPSHYADLLNMYDGGTRVQFTPETWIARLAALAGGSKEKT